LCGIVAAKNLFACSLKSRNK